MEVTKIINSDVLSIFSYYFAANWMARSKPGMATSTEEAMTLARMSQELWKVIQRKLNCMLNTPRAVVFNTSSGLGFGIDNIEALYFTAKLDNLLQSLQSPSKYCYYTTVDTIKELRAKTGWDLLRGDIKDKRNPMPSVKKCAGYPEYLREAGEGLRRSGKRIEANPHWHTGENCTLNDFLGLQSKVMVKNARWMHFLQLHGHRTLGELFGAGARPTGVMERMLRENDGGVMYTAFRDMVNVGTRLRVEGISGDLVKTLPRMMWGRAKRYRSHSWDAPTLFKDTGVINTMEELFSRKERQYASDGSLNDSRAGCAVVTEDESFMMSAIPGEQSVPRAEAYGLLLALLWQDLGTDITVHTDSKNTIDNVRKIRFDKGRDPRLWRKMENYALYSLIAAIIDMREGRGVVTNVVHVKSHTRRDDLPSVMNVAADRRAKEARDYSCLLREPYRYLPKYYVVSDTEGVSNIKTTYTHALWYYDMDEYLLRSAFRKAGPSQHIKFLEQEGSWVQASKLRRGKGSQHKNNIFAAKLGVGSLPTPRNIQVTNDRHFPDLYPGYACPLHVQDKEVANEHHIFCKCPAMAGVYEEGANRLADKIDGLLPLNRPASSTRTIIKGMLLPSQRKDFLYGKVPEELRRFLVSNIGQASSDKLKGRIKPLVRDFFFDIWCSYTAKIVEGGHDFASRLRKRYEIKVADLKRYGRNIPRGNGFPMEVAGCPEETEHRGGQ
ncbi:hypothetical protein CYMTET_7277 [Cymbomonas tetramitiformis]|uniref:RNase H type-1 domain-containing protein n=1 Tax=Cymbomonas tetramitiformis TaxID=36881 RepID=A0AAE0GXA4_9CHLO|nr:hypothetical protein CYMTET_7277 [Cymbomonas tetramitiformis]